MSPQEIAYFYEIGTLGGFSTQLMDLFGKADTTNRLRLSQAFPEYEKAYNLWFYKPEGWDNFNEGVQNVLSIK